MNEYIHWWQGTINVGKLLLTPKSRYIIQCVSDLVLCELEKLEQRVCSDDTEALSNK